MSAFTDLGLDLAKHYQMLISMYQDGALRCSFARQRQRQPRPSQALECFCRGCPYRRWTFCLHSSKEEEEGEQTGKEKGGKGEGRQKTRENRVAGEDKDD